MTVYGNGSITKPKVSSPFGPRQGGAYPFHYGTDFIGYADLKATDDGVVTYAGNRGTAAGYQVAYDIPEKGPNGETITIVRSHIAAGTIRVKVGQRIRQGQSIGTMGATGNPSGPCDHIEVRYWARGASVPNYQNPEAWFAARVGQGSAAGSGTKLKATQRLAIAEVNGRADPSTHRAPVGTPLKKGVVGNFTGWKHGQNVSGNDIWFLGTSGRWFWSGGFSSHSTAGLKNLNPPPVRRFTRRVVPNAGANARTSPTRAARIDASKSLKPNVVGTFDAWTRGQKVGGIDVWYRGAFSGRWYWAGGFTSHSTAGLRQV